MSRLMLVFAPLVMFALPLAGATWPEPVAGHVPLHANEHPRLLFRKEDVPALREKAETPVGRAMVARLKYLLGGGEAMPLEFNPYPPLNVGARGPQTLKPGAFCVSHAAGFGLLYQLTDEQKYAELARECLERVFAGQVDRDERYSWKEPGTGFRISGVLQAVALAYDLNFEAWDPAFRMRVAKEIATNAPKTVGGKGPYTLELLAKGGKYPPASNHYGAYIAGPGFAALALLGDDGVDSARMNEILATVDQSMRTLFTRGFGDGGWFGEGAGSDRTASQPGILGLIQAMRLCKGVDWCEGAPNARMVMLTRVLEMVATPEGAQRPPRGLYAHGSKVYGPKASFRDQGGWSSDGLFCIGMGALPPRYRPGMKYIYEQWIEPDQSPEERIYEARITPLTAVYAFVNWPIELPVERPESSEFPFVVHDSLHGYVLSRSGFAGESDILFTGLGRTGPFGYHKTRAQQDVWIWGMGYRVSMGQFPRQEVSHLAAAADGSASVSIGDQYWAIDFSGASGCDGAIVLWGKAPVKVEKLNAAPAVADEDIDLSGAWNAGVNKMTHKGNQVSITNKGKPFADGTIDGRTLTMVFRGKKELKGQVTTDANAIEWSNNYVWHRDGAKKRWQYTEGEKVKSATLTVGGVQVSMVTFDWDGQHPVPSEDGGALKLDEQRFTLVDGKLRMTKFDER